MPWTRACQAREPKGISSSRLSPNSRKKGRKGRRRDGGEDGSGVKRRDLRPARRHRIDRPHPRAQVEQRIAAEPAGRRVAQRGHRGEPDAGRRQPHAHEPEPAGPLAQQQNAQQRRQRREGAGNEDRGMGGRGMQQARAQHQREGNADGPRHRRRAPPARLARLEAVPERDRQQQRRRHADAQDGQVPGRDRLGDGKPGQRKPGAPEHHCQKC